MKQKFLSCITSLIFLLNIASPVVSFWGTVYAEELEQTPEVDSEVTTEESASEPASQPEEITSKETTAEQPAKEPPIQSEDLTQEENATVVEEQPQDQEGDILEDGASDYRPNAVAPTEEPVIEEPAAEKFTEEVVEVRELAQEAEETWEQGDDGYYETTKDVNVGETYEVPQNGKVTVKFTKIMEPGKLKVKEVKLSKDEVSNLNALSDIAYDISSTMEDGTFEYELTLPLPENTNERLGVMFSEDGWNYKTVDEEINVNKGGSSVEVLGLDHFTVFVLVNDTDNGGTGSTSDDVANGELTTIKDAWVNQSSVTTNNGDTNTLEIASRNSGRNKRALIQFNLSSLSSANTINKATLRLYMTDAPSLNRDYELYRVTSAGWVEGNGGTNNNPVGEVRWNNQPTSSVGASTVVSTGTTNNVWLEFDVTSDIADFVTGTSNYGWLIKDANESESGTNYTATFRSRENGTENQRPQLVVDFSEADDEPTDYKSPTAQAATTGGDGNGFETNATNAFADGGGAASNINGAGDRHLFYNYGFSVPSGATVNGIEVRMDWYLDADSNTNSLSVDLSWDGGTSWTAAETDSVETEREHVASLGGSSDTWGRTWDADNFSDTNFRVRVTSTSNNVNKDFFLDWIPVRIYYSPASDTTGPSVGAIVVSGDQDPYVDGNGFDVEVTVSDTESGIDSASCEYTMDGSTWVSALYDSGDQKCYVENITAADGASLTINMRVSDLAANQTEGSAISRTSDAANPLVDASSDVTTNISFTQDATASDDGVGILSYLWEKTSGPGTVTFGSSTSEDTTIEADFDGTYYITLTVEDAFGHSTSDEMVLTWDTTNPTDPITSSTTHTTSVWSTYSTVEVTWSGADDTLSGVDGFYTEWNTSQDTMAGPVTKKYEETVDSETSPVLADGSTHYFHIATLDNAGNWTSTAHFGPFYIDAGEPNTTLDVHSPDPTKENKPTFTGSTSDTTSNIVKVEYRILIEANSKVVKDWTDVVAVDGAFDELFEDFTFTSPNLTRGDRYLFQVRSTDDVGNVETTYAEDSLRIQMKSSNSSNGSNSGGDVAGASTQSPLENLIQNLITGTAFSEEAAQETAPENPTEGEVLATTEENPVEVLGSEVKKEFVWKWWIISISIVGGTIYLFFRKR